MYNSAAKNSLQQIHHSRLSNLFATTTALSCFRKLVFGLTRVGKSERPTVFCFFLGFGVTVRTIENNALFFNLNPLTFVRNKRLLSLYLFTFLSFLSTTATSKLHNCFYLPGFDILLSVPAISSFVPLIPSLLFSVPPPRAVHLTSIPDQTKAMERS